MQDYLYDFIISKIGNKKDQELMINILYGINRILSPPAKIIFLSWFFIWLFIAILISPVDAATNTINVTQGAFLILPLGYVILCGIADLIYFSDNERYQNYKEKILDKKNKRLRLVTMQYVNYGSLAVTKIQRRYGLEFNRANEIMRHLEQLGFVGAQFEYFCADILKRNGFVNV